MQLDYVLRRIFVFFVIIWAAASMNFFLPKMMGQDPIRQKIYQTAATTGYLQEGVSEIVEVYNKKFGLDKPIMVQYRTYLWDLLHFSLGFSISNYPTRVGALIADALPWTIGLIGVSLVISFVLGNLVGALVGWGMAPGYLKGLIPPLFAFSAVPYYLLGLVLLYVFAFQTSWMPLGGAFGFMTFPDVSVGFAFEVVKHAILPATSIVVASLGFQALGMRAMMITVQGEDYMTLGQAKGLRRGTLFLHYGMRNAMLPQATVFALSIGQVVSGAALVEIVFSYPGVGRLLYTSVQAFDYFLIQGIVFVLVLAIATTTLILDLVYPLLDPRISYRRS